MALPCRRPRTIPTSDAGALRRARIRTGLVRTVLVVVACGLLAVAFFSARGLEARSNEFVPGGRSGVVVIDVSLSIVNRDYARVRGVLEQIIRSDNPNGPRRVLGCGVRALAPANPGEGAPAAPAFLHARTLAGYRRTPGRRASRRARGSRPRSTWRRRCCCGIACRPLRSFSSAISRARPRTSRTWARRLLGFAESATTLRVVPLSATSDGRTFFGGILGTEAFVDPVEPNAGEARPIEVSFRGEAPLLLLLASAFVFLDARCARALRRDGSRCLRGRGGGSREKAPGTGRTRARVPRRRGCALRPRARRGAAAISASRRRRPLSRDAGSAPVGADGAGAGRGCAALARKWTTTSCFRRALRGVRLSHPEMPGYSDPSYVVHRNEATAWLTDIVQHGRRLRSQIRRGQPSRRPQLRGRDRRLHEQRQAARGGRRKVPAGDCPEPRKRRCQDQPRARTLAIERSRAHRGGRRKQPFPGRQGAPEAPGRATQAVATSLSLQL